MDRSHRVPSGPLVIRIRSSYPRLAGYSEVCPPVVMRPNWPMPSTNHSAPSGPVVISVGLLYGVGVGYSFICPMAGHDGGEIEVQTRAMLPASASVNHIAPSGPAVIRCAPLAGVGIGYSVTDPAKGQFAEAVVTQILPIWFADC